MELKIRKITIPHLFTLIAETPEKTFSRKVYEAELTNLDIGSVIETLLPLSLQEKCTFKQVLELVGYDEEMWIVTITSYNPQTGEDISKELVVFGYDS